MKQYKDFDRDELSAELSRLKAEYETIKARGRKLDMSRGKPSPEQLDIGTPLLSELIFPEDCKAGDGTDVRNYGVLAGIPECRRLFGELTGMPAENVVIYGESSLNLMYDTFARCMLFGADGSGAEPWAGKKIKFICPAPGYDRHFAICEDMGAEMLTVKMTPQGPDTDAVEELIKDPAVKGMWCVPKYSNPDGYTCSDETVKRLAAMKPAARDFRIFWDNAYIVHDLYAEGDGLLNIFDLTRGTENEDMVFEFVSTAKITFPGAGVAAFVSSDGNVKAMLSHMKAQTISHDKINQLRHVKYLKDAEHVKEIMKKHAQLLRPKFEMLKAKFREDLAQTSARWTEPKGGYFISMYVKPGTAKRVFALCRDAGLTLTNVGASYPYSNDPDDSNLRIAPSYPSPEALSSAADVLTLCVRIAEVESLSGQTV
ncbi:MAG: aminotransferase class I/II-fold pyridoxal phosphate-dependent enzyme [Clostridia bacterium]|nr:aminotransferase class I/II-fold pyridoxal phosphate-dependent enzyme [Clostridia bacterium]